MSKLVVLQPTKQPSIPLLPSSLSDFSGTKLCQIQYKRKVWQPKGALHVAAASTKKILVMGGTRFIGIFLSRLLVKEGHQVTLFTRGKAPITQQLPGEPDSEYSDFKSKILHLKGDRKDFEFVKSSLSAEGFDVVYDINGNVDFYLSTLSTGIELFINISQNILFVSSREYFLLQFSGREADEVEPILDALPNLEQYIYCSSAGVYLKSDLLPHCETDAVDPKSRHKGKLNTENLLASRGVNWTSLRPVYIYGPLNYNPVEEWFFHRLKAGRPIPIPNSGVQITQLGHVKDLAKAFIQVLGNEKASKQVFNISGEKYVTFDGLARACAKAAGFPEPEIVHYNPKEFDFGKKKAFPFRDQHFFASIEKAKHVLGWEPEFDLVEGLADSYNLDFGRGTYRKEADFSTDDMILGKSLVLQS
ncbi:PREDICTED: chloroplast stem-loop binding protein of 41 kDa b, chloroplastic isoform X1 [Theobroma cacao]|uniref:Chloroplast stem-loop binding protein of 41 kDa b, chloroplastic isoform X1 n=1 Tax=Theobroma cacao TaxID=3641 RepID=A0AB32WD03_THECC|nr:PREDICTED: chloroplast stem-loop binding protein of 41 kDa b, chloroplastic isoform X1 [Theobroma cacao]